MPNIDGGHYFLTVLVPIRVSAEVEPDGAVESPANRLRMLLALMPTVGDDDNRAVADVDPAIAARAETRPQISPFARNRLNHFVRFSVVDAINYNGRINGDGVLDLIRRINPAVAQPIDRLSRSYLLFSAEFDVNPHGAPEPEVYLDKLWDTMEPELRGIFDHCYRFAEVANAGDFVRYIKRCQIETSMPFNEYWTDAPHLRPIPTWLVSGVPALLGVAAGALFLWLVRDSVGVIVTWGGALLVGLAVALAAAVWIIMRHGAKPFPAAPHSTLERILKALYLQNQYINFAVAHQGDDAEILYDAFGKFLGEHRPSAAHPTQAPAVIGI
ncbi:MAG: hypothetical protein LH465_00380 [Sphingomonas bacterium]|nr:hypothetical protein [Sphingomonas bacterium]